MILTVYKVSSGWRGRVEHEGQIIVSSSIAERRVGCAVRTLLNELQRTHGAASFTELTINLEDW